MRFEVWYKSYLKEKVKSKGYDVVAVNDNAFKVNTLMDKSDKTVLMLVQGGNVTKSNIRNYDLNTMPVIVNFIVPLDKKNDFMSGLCDISESLNASLSSTDLNGKTIRFRGIYNTPYVLGETTEIRHGGGTMKVCAVQWIITLNFGENAYIYVPVLKLTINGTEYNVTQLMRFEFAYAPAYDNWQGFGKKKTDSVKLSEVRTFVLQVAMQDFIDQPVGTFQYLLFKIATGVIEVDSVSLWWIGHEIPIKQFSLSGATENNTGSYLISLEA